MGACLGIYLGDKMVKYAKLIQDDKNKKVSLAAYGTKYVTGDKEESISEIISQTASADSPLCLNLAEYYKIETELLKQLGKSDVQSVISLEVADFAGNQGINEKTLAYRHMIMDSSVSNDNYLVEIAATENSNIAKYINKDKYKNLVGIYPQEYIVNNLVQDHSNYMIVNMDEKTNIISVVGGRIHSITELDISMKNILDNVAEFEGSYLRACDVCRGINVLSEDEALTPELEKIIEPVIQDVLNRIKSKLEQNKIVFEKIYLNGLINLFINIDMLFEQFFGISTEKLKPSFLKTQELPSNIAEIIEANEAISLAYEGLNKTYTELNFVEQSKNSFSFKSLLGNPNKTNNKSDADAVRSKKSTSVPNFNLNVNKDKIESALLFTNIAAGMLFLGYAGFSTIYNMELSSMERDLTKKIDQIQNQTVKIRDDVNYININTKEYTTYNTYISDTLSKIDEGKIGKYTTYNVANFMQKIARYIPSNVELQTISSNDNKSVEIVAKSTSYAELGYFISQLKLQGILENVKTGQVETGATITVTIGGDLP